MRLAHPWLLLLLLLVPLIFYRERARRSAVEAALRVPDMVALRAAGSSLRTRFVRLLPYLETAALILCVLILARPQSGVREREVLSEGIDIVLAMDISGSMKAMDLKPNRLIAAKEVAKSFVEGRQGDRIGLVVFAADSFTQCPLTLDYGVLRDLIDQVDFGVIEDGTAIGMGIANASNRLKDSKAKSKVIILLTDGVNNAGRVDPVTAARLAEALGIRIYTVGAGVEGEAPYPVDDPVFGRRTMMVRSTIDEKTLGSIAEITGGEFFRARDEGTLKSIYERISTMEKTTVESREFVRYDELGPIMLLPAFILLAGVLLLESTLFLKVP
jgi:Ca-activated chloride channel family protein